MSYLKVTTSQTSTWDFCATDTIEGIYRSHKENVGPNNSRMYDIELENGEVVPVWGSTVLDSQMNGVKYGDRIKITYF